MRILLKNAKVLTFNETNEILDRGDVLIEDRKIIRIGENIGENAG